MKIKISFALLLLLPVLAFGGDDAVSGVPCSETVEAENKTQAESPEVPVAVPEENRTEAVKKKVVMDERGRVKRVDQSNGEFLEYSYHPSLNKISQVLTQEGKTDFSYDKKGNLIRAENSQGQFISLTYDRHNHIIRMVELNLVERTQRELRFKYNAMNKPTRIKLIGKGEINVQYDKHGEITKVKSKQGASMALGVTAAFQTLMSVVGVAKVDLCPE